MAGLERFLAKEHDFGVSYFHFSDFSEIAIEVSDFNFKNFNRTLLKNGELFQFCIKRLGKFQELFDL